MPDFDAVLRGAGEVDLLGRITDPGYWDNVFAPRGSDEVRPTIRGSASEGARESLHHEGFFSVSRLLSTEAARHAVEQAEQAGWPPVFAFFASAVWDLLCSTSMVTLLGDLLGPGARIQPGVWAKRVTAGSAGWEPHVDVAKGSPAAPGGEPMRLTVWVALTDVGVDQGCIHVVPNTTAPEVIKHWADDRPVPAAVMRELLHGVVALAAPAGTVLGWDASTLHWGGPHRATGAPDRVSLALEVRHESAPSSMCEEPSLPLGAVPDFATRLAIVGHSLLAYGAYEDREPGLRPFLHLARSWMHPRG